MTVTLHPLHMRGGLAGRRKKYTQWSRGLLRRLFLLHVQFWALTYNHHLSYSTTNCRCYRMLAFND